MPAESLRRKIYGILETHDHVNRWGVIFNITLFSLILLNVAAVIAASFHGFYEAYREFFDSFEVFSVVFFSIEYLARWWVAPERLPVSKHPRLKHAASFYSLIDLFAILPFFIPLLIPVDLRFLRIIRLLRLIRVFKFTRYLESFDVVGRVLKRERKTLFASFALLSLLLLIASCIMFAVENEAQPEKFPNIVETLWWAVVTLTTVGYGDVFPNTPLGKVLAGAISIIGIGVVALPTGIISSGFIAELSRAKKPKPTICPHCGKEIDHKE